MRRLIFCFDGSWNKLTLDRPMTNVVRVAESILPVSKGGTSQIVYYDEGVGTPSNETVRGGAFGKGLLKNMREAYRFLIFNYRSGDEIFVFGFSRGGFTALSFVGFLRCAGIIGSDSAGAIDRALDLYQRFASDVDDPRVVSKALRTFRAKQCGALCIDDDEYQWRCDNIDGYDKVHARKDVHYLKIRYVGVWDAVGSLGSSVVRAILRLPNSNVYRGHNTALRANVVETARHAVAIDERRVHFAPTLWTNLDEMNAGYRAMHPDGVDPPYQQRWFPGDHGSIGGGGTEYGLAFGPLQWIVEGASKAGLRFNFIGASRLRDIRYDPKVSLRNTPVSGIGARLFDIFKRLALSANRIGPQRFEDIARPALRRWVTAPGLLAEGQCYRPGPLRRFTEEIEAHRGEFERVERKVDFEVVIADDDTWLSRIAADAYGDARLWPIIFDENRDWLDDPDYLSPGDEIRVPILDRIAIDYELSKLAPLATALSPDSVVASVPPAPGSPLV